jgi:hypothetical protein
MKGLPLLPERFATYAAFNGAGLAEVAGAARTNVCEHRITWMPSTVFLNRGGRFEAVALPPEAQFAPAFGVVAADLDGDGNPDLFLAQNFHGGHPKMPRMDAGLGLVLLGDGTGTFRALSAGQSGVRIFGEQRGAAWADFDADGRPDLAVGVNHGAPVLLRNVSTTSTAALRLRLDAGPGNPTGIGASVRRVGAGRSPRLEVHAGSGAGSQDDAALLLRRTGTNGAVDVTWPDGRTERRPLSEDRPESVLRKGSTP